MLASILHTILPIHCRQEILVGFRTHPGILTTTQSFKTIEIPRLVRGKPNAWDPAVCFDWGRTFLEFLKDIIRANAQVDSERSKPKPNVWRVRFVPKDRVTVELLDDTGVEDVEGGEDRVGFLPRWYWDEEIQRLGVDGTGARKESGRDIAGENPISSLNRTVPTSTPSVAVSEGWRI